MNFSMLAAINAVSAHRQSYKGATPEFASPTTDPTGLSLEKWAYVRSYCSNISVLYSQTHARDDLRCLGLQ